MTAVLDRMRGDIDETADRLRRRITPEHVLLIIVSAAYCLLIVWRTSQSLPLTYDEVVYASQLSPDMPASDFTAHRARGMSLLLAPVTLVTHDVFALRVYLTLLAAAGLYLAFRPWLAVARRAGDRYRFVPPLAAAIFASLWITILYGGLGYPNLWVGFALVAGVGYFCQAVGTRSPGWAPLAGTAIAFAAGSLIRPTDALPVAGPLLVAALLVPAWRRLPAVLAVLAGLLAGWLPWIIEAYARFGGPVQRFRDGGESTGSGLVNAFPANFDALDGPEVLCRPASECAGVSLIAAAWWFAIPVLVVVGLAVAARTRWFGEAALAVAAAGAVAAPYLFLIDYAAPRFLLAAYGLLAIPVAAALLWLVGLGGAPVRMVTAAALAAGLLLHLAVQLNVLQTVREPIEDTGRRLSVVAEFLREQGVRSPCLIWGEGAVQLSYPLGCRPVWEQGGDAPSEEDTEITDAVARGEDVVVRIRDDEAGDLPDFMAGWRSVDPPGDRAYIAYLSPSTVPTGTG